MRRKKRMTLSGLRQYISELEGVHFEFDTRRQRHYDPFCPQQGRLIFRELEISEFMNRVVLTDNNGGNMSFGMVKYADMRETPRGCEITLYCGVPCTGILLGTYIIFGILNTVAECV